MRLLKFSALALLLASPVSMAQTASPAHMQLAAKMYDLSEPGSVFKAMQNNIMGNVMGSIGEGLGPKASCPALQPEAQTFQSKMDGIFAGFADAKFRTDAMKVYSDMFTDDEMKQIIAFMQSPAALKLKRLQPDIGKRVAALAEARVKSREGDIRAAADAMNANVQRIAATCPAAPAPSQTPPPKK